MYLTAGQRREKACRTLEARAHELAWQGGVLQNDSWDNVKSLAGLTQLLICKLKALWLAMLIFA